METKQYRKDLKLSIRTGPDFYGIGADLAVGRGDLETVSGPWSVGQSIIHRLLTRKGELADIGFPRYGSRLHELIGSSNDAATWDMIRHYTRDSLSEEPAVREVLDIAVRSLEANPHTAVIEIAVLLAGEEQPLSLKMNYSLEVAHDV